MHDFRRLPGKVAGTLSPELRLEIRKAAGRREVALELREDLNLPPRAFSLTAELEEDPEVVGTRIRQALEVTAATQFAWRYGYESFNRWRTRVERLDVLVCQMTQVPPGESRGFSMSEQLLPVLCLNIKDPPQARCFSIMHELTHVMLRSGGLCDFDDHTARPPEDLAAERFSNRVAAATLMPAEAVVAESVVRSHSRGSAWTDDDIGTEAARFGVSREAFVRRLLTLGLVTEEFYGRKRRQYEAERDRLQESRTEGFAPPDRIALSAAGPSFARIVLESFYQERITASDVADFLDVRLKHLHKIEAALQAGSETG
jgi:Zn-dependent peptidase ImmA (M78 family)